MSTSWTLQSPPPASLLLLLPLLLLPVVIDGGVTLNITNRCSYTVWPAASPVGGGMQLDPGKTWTLHMPAGTPPGRVWARTGCSFDGNGNGSCQTGDCGGVLNCTAGGQPPATAAEFSLNWLNKSLDYFDISLVDGFNVPMDFLPVPAQGQGGPGCSKGPRCPADITSQCPKELKVPGGCSGACMPTQNNCKPTTPENTTNYTVFYVRMCPDAFSYTKELLPGYHSQPTTFTCPSGTNYQVVFCPPIDLTSSPPIPPPAPIAIGPTSMRSSTNKGRAVGLISGSIGGFIFLISFILFILHKRRSRRRQEMEEEEEELGKLPGMPLRFTFQQLEIATEKFRDKLGEGGFGSVFEGRFGDERIAVKRLDRAGQEKTDFLAEVRTIGSIHHLNLVRMIGFCAEKSHRLLVYEYMPKGSLDRWIYYRHADHSPPLDWQTRRQIITHIAKGLSYLHEECMKRIAHLDVKPQNILLDDNFNAKLSDFGLCKLIDRDKSQVITRMRGTPGYLAPEWLTSQITEKADVYSFGVVVMEIISGRKNLDTCRSEDSIHLITVLEEKVKNDRLEDLIDRHSNDMQVHRQDIIQMMKLAMWCLQIDCKRRPKMSVVVKVLEGTMNVETNIDHNFVVTSIAIFGVARNVDDSAPPLDSNVSGPR